MYKLIEKFEKIPVIYLVTFFFVLTLIVYGSSLLNGFVWDDEEQIVNNAAIQNINSIPYLFTSSTFNTGGAGLSGWYYKPLMPISFSIVHSIFGINSFGFHLFDVNLHLINSILVFLVFKTLFKLQKFQFSKSLSFLLASIFLIHPANTESVAYISSTQELLYVFFLLITIYFLSKQNKKLSIKKALFLCLTILFSLLSKESGVVIIPLVILFTFLFNKKNTLLITIASISTFIFYLILRFPIAKTPILQHSKIIPIANISFIDRLKTIPFEIFSYLKLFVFPQDLFVAQHWTVTKISDPRFYLTLPLAIALFLLIIFILIRLKSKLSIFFTGWIIFSFFLLLNIYPLDMTLAERWLYGPMIGLLGLIGVIVKKTSQKKLFLFFAFLILLIPIFSVRTIVRTFDWKSNLTLFSRDEKFSLESFDLQNNLGVALFRKGDIYEAKKHFEKSILLSPEWWTASNNLGAIYQKEGNINQAKKLYSISIKNGDYYLAYENLAQLKYNTEDLDSTITFLENSLKKLPNNETLNKLAAISYLQKGATESAKIYAERAFFIRNSKENYLLLQTINDNLNNGN
ncbi:MAG: tetratricopeptide repeat protein [Candidatus Levyibacteriota bacterium]